MAHTIPTNEPAFLRAGDTATWTKTLAEYPASAGWALTYTLVKTGVKISISSSASGDDHLVAVAPATTAGWAAGAYQFIGQVALSGAVYTVVQGMIEIAASFAAATSGLDARSHAVKTLAAIESWIEGRDIGVAEYEIAGRRLKAIPIADLLAIRDRYRREVRGEQDAQRAAAGLPNRNKILVRM